MMVAFVLSSDRPTIIINFEPNRVSNPVSFERKWTREWRFMDRSVFYWRVQTEKNIFWSAKYQPLRQVGRIISINVFVISMHLCTKFGEFSLTYLAPPPPPHTHTHPHQHQYHYLYFYVSYGNFMTFPKIYLAKKVVAMNNYDDVITHWKMNMTHISCRKLFTYF